jgi:hypothetical protein
VRYSRRANLRDPELTRPDENPIVSLNYVGEAAEMGTDTYPACVTIGLSSKAPERIVKWKTGNKQAHTTLSGES